MAFNKDEIDAVAKATAEIIKATPIYQDAAQPVVQEMGKAFGTLGKAINMALAPVAVMVYGFDRIKDDLQRRLEVRLSEIPAENIITPQLQIVGPILDKYKYTFDKEDLSQMFINLLANAMDRDHIQKAHPSFVNVISELSPDEAKLIKAIAQEYVLPKLDILLEYKQVDGKEMGHTNLYLNFTLLGEKANLQYPDLTPAYLSNLERLNIIDCPVGTFNSSYTEKGYYKDLEEHAFISTLREQHEKDGDTIKITQGSIRITEFGALFIEAVI